MYDVCIAGLGPVGGTLAALLGSRGVTAIVIERELAPYDQPRAAHFDGETMRTFQALGLVDAILPHVRPAPRYDFIGANNDILISVAASELSSDGWESHYMIYQPGVERALRDRCEALASVSLTLGATVTSIEQHPNFVDVGYREAAGQKGAVRARIVVGCDGASSQVRSLMGVALDDYAFDEPWLVIDVRDEGDRLPEACIQYCNPARPITFTQMGPGRKRWEFMILPGEDPNAMLADDKVEALLAPWGGLEGLHVERRAVYRFHGLIAREWRRGRVLLAGDSAHQMPPFAGQGMCSGIRDAMNLAWKVDEAVKGGPLDLLLDSYQLEREPHARGIVETAIEAGRVVCTIDPEIAEMRDRKAREDRANGVAMPALNLPELGRSHLFGRSPVAGKRFPQPIGTDGQRLDDVLADGPWLIENAARQDARASDRHFATGDAILAPFRTALEDWFAGNGNHPAVLVRPDRMIFDTGHAIELWRAWATVLEPAART